MTKFLPVLVLIFALGVIGFLFLNERTNPNPLFPTPTPYPTLNPDSDFEVTVSPATSKNIEVLSPREGDQVRTGFVVSGNARVFENVVSIRLIDSLGNILSETTVMANAPDVGKFGPFEEVLDFKTNDTTGILEVYQSSAKDGSEIDKVRVNLQFTK